MLLSTFTIAMVQFKIEPGMGKDFMRYKALALDLDGTLTNSSKQLSEENKIAIHKAIDKGVAVILASGRPVLGITHLVKELNLEEKGGYVLAYNGGSIIDCKSGELLYERILPNQCISAICESAHNHHVVAMTYTEDEIVAEDDEDEYMIKEAICNSARIKKVDNLESFVDYPVSKFLVVGEHEKLLHVQKELLSLFTGVLDVFFSESYFLEVVPAGVAKSTSLDNLLTTLNLDRKELMACGDGLNDIPMLEYAGFAVAMENAYPEVKGYADYITLSNDDNGVAYAIEKFILN